MITKKAFTLAEILIAVAIIGIIGALAIPNVRSAGKQKEIFSKANKAALTLDTAIVSMMKDYGTFDTVIRGKTTDSEASEAVVSTLGKYIKYNTKCIKTSENNACFYTGTIKKSDNTEFSPTYPETSNALPTPGDSANCSSAIINDGNAIALCVSSADYNSCTQSYCPIASVWIDINGPINGPNKLSEDIFFGYIDDAGFKEGYESISALEDGSFND